MPPAGHPAIDDRELAVGRRPIDAGWQVAGAPADAAATPAALDGLEWLPARVPGTVAGALRDAGLWRPGEAADLDGRDWWFRTTFEAEPAGPGEELLLRLDGIATVADVHLNGEPLLHSPSMFLGQTADVGGLIRSGANELAIRCRALDPLLAVRRRPRARWRTRLVSQGNLRFFRTSLLGRAPGFAPGPAAVGPFRPIVIEHRRGLSLEQPVLRARLDGDAGVLAISVRARSLDGEPVGQASAELSGPSGEHRAALAPRGGDELTGELRIPGVARWWPHTHGEPALHEVRLCFERDGGPLSVDAGHVGFRALTAGPTADHDVERDGLDLHVNGIRVFARGAVWTPADPVGLAPSEDELRGVLESVRDAGMNMLRVPGIGAYESDAFHDLCDELGLLVWQDFMFANLDYPVADEEFRDLVAREAAAQLGRIGHRPSLTVLCGNSEVEQQVAMLGLDPELGRGELFGELLPALSAEASPGVPYVPSAPCGGDLPFRPDRGIANYYGVGAYRRPLEDARRSGVRFAAECLAFANVPDEEGVAAVGADAVHDPRWKAGVPRDAGAGWDFEDVRDHYLALLYGVDPVDLRWTDHERYLELSRAVSGEVMAEVFGEWRRAGSPCGGALVLWLRDLVAGAGWGVLDHRGRPKPAYHHLRRALAPVAVWTVDEGLGGIAVHVANDRPEPLAARLRVALYRDLEHRVEDAVEEVEVGPHGALERNVEAMVGRFVDASWAYRFGPPNHDLVVASLERDDAVISQAVRFPAGRPARPEPAARLGLEVSARPLDDGRLSVTVRARRLAHGARLEFPGWLPDDDAFAVEPGHERRITLRRLDPDVAAGDGMLTAVNLEGRLRVAIQEPSA